MLGNKGTYSRGLLAAERIALGYDNNFSGRLVQNEIYKPSRVKYNFHLRPHTGNLTLS